MEQRLREAMLAGDVGTLDARIADDLVFVTQTGTLATKAMDLEAHRSRVLRLNALEPSEGIVRRFGETAVVSVRVRVAGDYAGTPFAGAYRYLRVWARVAGRWQVVAGQVTAVEG